MANNYIQNYPDGQVIIEEVYPLTLTDPPTYRLTFLDGRVFLVNRYYMMEAERALLAQKRFWNATELRKFCVKESQYIPFENV